MIDKSLLLPMVQELKALINEEYLRSGKVIELGQFEENDLNVLDLDVDNLLIIIENLINRIINNYELTDDAINVDPLNLSTLNIANCKQIKHVMDGLCLFKGIPRSEYDKYGYVQISKDAKTGVKQKSDFIPLDLNKTYYVCKVDKNRNGDKPNLMFELNLDFNTWFEVGLAYSKAQYDREQNAKALKNSATTREQNAKKTKKTTKI